MVVIERTIHDSRRRKVFKYAVELPETCDEAYDLWAPAIVDRLLFTALKVRFDTVAHRMFLRGKTRKEVEDRLRTYIPGGSLQKKESLVMKLLEEHAEEIKESGKALDIAEMVLHKRFDDVIAVINELKEGQNGSNI